MAAEKGNTYAVGHGRPPSVSAQLGTIEQAVARLERLAEQALLAELLGAGPEAKAAAEARARVVADIRHLRAAAERLAGHAPAIEACRPKRRKRRRRHPNGLARIHSTRFARDVSQAAVLLDRLIPADPEAAQ